MTNPVLVVRRQVRHGTEEPLGRGCWVWCPACDEAHRFEILGEDGSHPDRADHWSWDGNLEAPTFVGSMLVTAAWGPDRVERRCHSFVRAGRWEFLGDCTHELAGQTVAMVPLPDWLV